MEAQQQYNPCTDLSRMHYSPRLPPPNNMVLSTLSNSGCTTAAWTLLDGFFSGLASLSSSYSGAPHGTTGGQITLFLMRFLLKCVSFPKLPWSMSMSYVRLIVNYFPCCQAKGKASERGADGKETSFQEERLEEEDRERRSGQVVAFRKMFSQARFSQSFHRFAFHKEPTSRSAQRASSSKRIEDLNFAIENTLLLSGGEEMMIDVNANGKPNFFYLDLKTINSK